MNFFKTFFEIIIIKLGVLSFMHKYFYENLPASFQDMFKNTISTVTLVIMIFASQSCFKVWCSWFYLPNLPYLAVGEDYCFLYRQLHIYSFTEPRHLLQHAFHSSNPCPRNQDQVVCKKKRRYHLSIEVNHFLHSMQPLSKPCHVEREKKG